MDMEYGQLVFHIEELLQERGISKNQICKALDIPRSNFNRYCRNEFQRIDAALVCKLCAYLQLQFLPELQKELFRHRVFCSRVQRKKRNNGVHSSQQFR